MIFDDPPAVDLTIHDVPRGMGFQTFCERFDSKEQHSDDWSSWIGREGHKWRVCFRGSMLDLLKTRKAARARIREYKADPRLAEVAAVQLS